MQQWIVSIFILALLTSCVKKKLLTDPTQLVSPNDQPPLTVPTPMTVPTPTPPKAPPDPKAVYSSCNGVKQAGLSDGLQTFLTGLYRIGSPDQIHFCRLEDRPYDAKDIFPSCQTVKSITFRREAT